DIDCCAEVERTGFQPGREGLPFHEFHRDEEIALVLVNLVNGTDMRMIESGNGLGLPEKPGFVILRPACRTGKELERGEAVKLRVFGLIHDAHAALAELLQKRVMRYRLSDRHFPLTSSI